MIGFLELVDENGRNFTIKVSSIVIFEPCKHKGGCYITYEVGQDRKTVWVMESYEGIKRKLNQQEAK